MIDGDIRIEIHKDRKPVFSQHFWRNSIGEGLFNIAFSLWLFAFNFECEIGWWSGV